MNKYFRPMLRILVALSVFGLTGAAQSVQNTPDSRSGNNIAPDPKPPVSELDQIKQALEAQQKELAKLQAQVAEQALIIARLQNPPTDQVPAGQQTARNPVPAQTDTIENRLAKVEEQSKKTSEAIAGNQFRNLGFSGEVRMQYDSLYGLLNNAANIADPAILGNELSSRQRLRYRLRFAVRGRIGGDVFSGAYTAGGEKRLEKEFEWGFRFSAGSLSNPVAGNAVLTDFFSRKPISIDQAFVAWRPRAIAGLRIIAGKFEPTWTRTELTIDNDLQVEGISEIYSRDLKNSVLKNITFDAWQLPLLERGTVFVRNANGTVNIEESRRNGRDLGLFGAQLQAKFALSAGTGLTLSVADQYFTNTQAINPIQVFGGNLQLPVTITIPATPTTPAQTVTGVVSIPRELLLSGNGNPGLSSATNAAVNRNGRLASGFNLVELIAQLDLKQFKFNPVTILFDYVRNTQTRDVTVADPAGNDRVLPNHYNDGLWAEFRFQNLRRNRTADFSAPVNGDVLLSYTFLRIEKDAVLTPFNWDDPVQASDVQAHRMFFSYTVDPRVTFNFTGLFSRRLHGLSGPFAPAPAGSLDRTAKRFQIDTVFRF